MSRQRSAPDGDASLDVVALAERMLGASDGAHVPAAGLHDVRRFYRPRAAGSAGSHPAPVRSLHVPLARPDQGESSGFLTQPVMVADVIASTEPRPRSVVELGCGEGFNTFHLARANPKIRFVGLDLLPEHIATAADHRGRTPNAHFLVADFHRLPFPSGAVDLVFSVESIIHSLDMEQVLLQIHQVLRPGGALSVIELFRAPASPAVGSPLQRMCSLTEALLAVPAMWELSSWIALADRIGFVAEDTVDLTGAALPNLRRMMRLGERRLQRGLPPDDELKPILAGLLICQTLQLRGHGLYALRFTRR